MIFREAERRFLLLFLEKEGCCSSEDTVVHILGGKPPNPQGSLRSKFWAGGTFREAEQRFLLLFLEKEEFCPPENYVDHM
jgi:hypothetical protein